MRADFEKWNVLFSDNGGGLLLGRRVEEKSHIVPQETNKDLYGHVFSQLYCWLGRGDSADHDDGDWEQHPVPDLRVQV